jgi:hypothetical protein
MNVIPEQIIFVSRGITVLVSSVGSFFSYVNDARSHEPEVIDVCCESYSKHVKAYTMCKKIVFFMLLWVLDKVTAVL